MNGFKIKGSITMGVKRYRYIDGEKGDEQYLKAKGEESEAVTMFMHSLIERAEMKASKYRNVALLSNACWILVYYWW